MPPFWNLVSLALPVVATIIGSIALGFNRASDLGGALGGFLLLLIVIGAVSVVGEAAAIAALVRGERFAALSVLGILLNGAAIAVAAILVFRMQ